MSVKTEHNGKKVGDFIKNTWGWYKILGFVGDDRVRIMAYDARGGGALVADKLNPDGYIGKIENYDFNTENPTGQILDK